MTVTKNQFINADLESSDLIVTTDSIVGSNDLISVMIYDATSDTDIAAIRVKFETSKVTYHIGKCTASNAYDQFTTQPPSDVKKTWRFVKKTDTLEVYCNEQKVLDYTYSSSAQGGCATQWGLKAARIKFISSGNADTASDKYAIEPKTTIGKSSEVVGQCHCLIHESGSSKFLVLVESNRGHKLLTAINHALL